MLGRFKRVVYAFKREGQFKAALIPMNPEEIHPVFLTHAKILQSKTSFLIPTRVLHVIGRLPKIFKWLRYSYISEVEGATGPAPIEFTKLNFDLDRAQDFINNDIAKGRLKRIVFQSESAYKLHQKWMTEEMFKVSTFVNMVPPEIIESNNVSSSKIMLLMIVSNPVLKGVFIVPNLVKGLVQEGVDFKLTIVCGRNVTIESGFEDYVEFLYVERLTVLQKIKLFDKHHFLLNISPMDTLGSFLDSIWFNTPMITVPGQHAETYIDDRETGYIIQSPIYYYSDLWGKSYSNVKSEFKDFLLKMDLSEWDPMIAEVVFICKGFEYSKYREMCNKQYLKSIDNFTVDKWLYSWSKVYESSDIL